MQLYEIALIERETQQEVAEERAKRLRYPGNRRWSKLTLEQVIEIHRLWREGVSMIKLAKMFGVTRQNIHHLLTGKTWGEVQVPAEVA